jgi:hypothetical protein
MPRAGIVETNLGELKKRKVLIIAFGLASLGAIASVRPAAAIQTCHAVCDQWAIDNRGQLRCFSTHQACAAGGIWNNMFGAPKAPPAPPQPISSGGGGAQHGKLKPN